MFCGQSVVKRWSYLYYFSTDDVSFFHSIFTSHYRLVSDLLFINMRFKILEKLNIFFYWSIMFTHCYSVISHFWNISIWLVETFVIVHTFLEDVYKPDSDPCLHTINVSCILVP